MGEYADMAIDEGIYDWGDDREGYNPSKSSDPLYYHIYHNNTTVDYETDKAYLVTFSDNKQGWVAKALCRHVEKASVYIHRSYKFVPINNIEEI